MSNVEFISSLDDPRIDAYRDLKDRELARNGNRFIAEGEHLVRRLLDSDYPVESVLLAHRRAEEIAPLVTSSIPVYVLPDPVMHQVLGYKFHSGVIACGRRKPVASLEAIMSALPPRATIVICPDTNNSENLGVLMRLAAGFGAHAMILGPQCCDPFYRRSIRVSMGAIFRLNLHQSQDMLLDLKKLQDDWQVELIAAVLDESAQPLHAAARKDRIALLFGNEAQGLPVQIIASCDRRVTIPMRLGVDSLNVSVAAGIFLHHFCNLADLPLDQSR